MTPPQLEAGFTRISNEIIEALAGIRISGEEMQCLWVILRKTYGWGKDEDIITLGQFKMMTNIKKPNIKRALNKLLSKKIIIINIDNVGMKIYKINKDLEDWRPLSKKITTGKALSKKIIGVINIDNRSISGVKETVIKERINYCGFAELWNETVTGNLPKIRNQNKLSSSRKEAIKKAWKDYNKLDDWRQIFQALSESPHHQGDNDRNWIAYFDWILKPKNYPRFYDLAEAKKKPSPKNIIASQANVGAHEERERTKEEIELHSLRRQKTFAKRDEAEELKPQQVERLEELERGLVVG